MLHNITLHVVLEYVTHYITSHIMLHVALHNVTLDVTFHYITLQVIHCMFSFWLMANMPKQKHEMSNCSEKTEGPRTILSMPSQDVNCSLLMSVLKMYLNTWVFDKKHLNDCLITIVIGLAVACSWWPTLKRVSDPQ